MDIQENETVDLRSLFIQYLLHWKLIIGTGIVSVIVAILYLVFYPKTFEATAQILLQDDKESVGGGGVLGESAGLMKSFGLSTNGSSSIVLDDELVILTSNQLVRDMVAKLGLYVDYCEPFTFGYRMYTTTPLKVSVDSINLNKMTHSIKMKVNHHENGSVSIKAKMKYSTFNVVKKTFELPSLPGEFEFQGIKVHMDYSPINTERNKGFKLLVDVNPPTGVAESLISDFKIEDYSKSSNVLQMSCLDYETERAKDMFNVLIDCYNQQTNKYKRNLSIKTLDFINTKLNSTVEELAKIESTIASYKSKNNITMVEYDMQMNVTAMQEIKTKLIDLQSQKHLIDMMDQFVKDPENKYKLIPTLYTPSISGHDANSASPLASYNQILIERERVIKNSSELNPKVVTLSLQADRLRESVFAMIENSKKSLELSEADLKAKERSLLSKMNHLPQQELTYVDLKRQQEIYQGVYLVLLQKRESLEMDLIGGKERARIIDAPYIKSGVVAPRKLYALVGVIVFTFLFSAFWLCVKWFVLMVWGDLKKAQKK